MICIERIFWMYRGQPYPVSVNESETITIARELRALDGGIGPALPCARLAERS